MVCGCLSAGWVCFWCTRGLQTAARAALCLNILTGGIGFLNVWIDDYIRKLGIALIAFAGIGVAAALIGMCRPSGKRRSMAIGGVLAVCVCGAYVGIGVWLAGHVHDSFSEGSKEEDIWWQVVMGASCFVIFVAAIDHFFFASSFLRAWCAKSGSVPEYAGSAGAGATSTGGAGQGGGRV